MGFMTSVFVYVLIWWLVLFTTLPLGVKRHEEKDKGYDAGAPAKADIKKKMILTSAISLVILGVLQVLIWKGILNHHMLFEGLE